MSASIKIKPWQDNELVYINGLPCIYDAYGANPINWEVYMHGRGKPIPLATLRKNGYRISYPTRPRLLDKVAPGEVKRRTARR